ncbi:hypothetical protein MUK60_07405 [Streptomyces sp. LRE541]|uniref:hypothetical protein n=1 Tax=Streptomyces sp. LRE541 TaxID=2931983 RepID=UPI00200C7DE5|nr:hypothetical protein [Streptomyces sp. LRE541]UPZ27659.1 hypothetical protein MUK60_07405 [Streptomyces sp. LRE541]
MNRRDWNELYALRWDEADGEHTLTGTSRDTHLNAETVHRNGITGRVWNIAVLDERGHDVTGRFFDHLDQAAS